MALTPDQLDILGKNLADARERRGWNVTYAAGRAGIAISALSQWENAKREPEVSAIIGLAIAYECSVDMLLSGVVPRYDAIIERGIPLDVQRHYDMKIDAAMARLRDI